jgi:hypothetical protein
MGKNFAVGHLDGRYQTIRDRECGLAVILVYDLFGRILAGIFPGFGSPHTIRHNEEAALRDLFTFYGGNMEGNIVFIITGLATHVALSIKVKFQDIPHLNLNVEPIDKYI